MTPAMSVPGSGGAQEPSVDRLSAVCWITAATLLFFLCVARLGVLLCFVLGTQVSSMVAPGALVLALIAGDRLGRANGFRGRLLVAPLAIVLIVMAGALALSAAFFDLSWDGLWYHQTAAYQMAKGYFHEVRIAGFGPLFSGVLLVSGVLFAGVLRRRGARRDLVLLASAAIVLSLLVSQHTWWARYGPQLWWLPILPIAAVLGGTSGRLMRWTARGAATLLLANALLVAFAHLRWEIAATRATEAQLAELRGKGEIDVDLQYFAEPFGERLRAGGVRFRVPERLACADPVELMSVAPGYPGAVRACVPKE